MRIFSMVTHGVGGMKRDDAAATYQVWSSDSYLPGNNKREGAIMTRIDPPDPFCHCCWVRVDHKSACNA